jgi:hypothetical protein
MFHLCSLDAPSIKNIALTINKNVANNPKIHLGINRLDTQVKKDIGLIKYKGWDVYTNSVNAPTTYTFPKYAGYTTYDEIKTKYADYLTTDIDGNGVWTEHLPDLEQGFYTDGDGMFWGCSALKSFNADLSSLEYSSYMFEGCSLTSFNSHLTSLIKSYRMFYGCTALTSFSSELPSMTHGSSMFYGCIALNSFNGDLPSMTHGDYMFTGCTALTSFNSDLPSLTNGYNMFYNCSKLTSFDSDLSNLTNGGSMF